MIRCRQYKTTLTFDKFWSVSQMEWWVISLPRPTVHVQKFSKWHPAVGLWSDRLAYGLTSWPVVGPVGLSSDRSACGLTSRPVVWPVGLWSDQMVRGLTCWWSVVHRFETVDGSATANSDYVPVKEVLVFEKDEVLKHVDIEIIDDNEWEPDEIFFVKIALDPLDQSAAEFAVIGKKAVQEITIIDDDGTPPPCPPHTRWKLKEKICFKILFN